MEPLDLTLHPPRSCREKLDGLMMLPRTIDKIRALLPGGNPGCYSINGKNLGLSGYLLVRLGIPEDEFTKIVAEAPDDAEVASRVRERVKPDMYPVINATLVQIRPEQAEDPQYVRGVYVETLEQHPHLVTMFDIIEADDRRMFAQR